MPNTPSAKKRLRQSIDNRTRNRAAKSTLRTQLRKVREAIAAGDLTKAEAGFKVAVAQLDRAAGRGILHRNMVARTKSRLNKALKVAKG